MDFYKTYRPPGVKPFVIHGSSSNIANIPDHPEAVLKYPKWLNELCLLKFNVESQILQYLGPHPRIVRYLGVSDKPRGIKLGKEINGDLQQWLENHSQSEIGESQRLKWCRDAAEAVSYIHKKEVLHCDLRPANYLLDEHLNLRLCDFGGSRFGELNGRGLPDDGFYDPNDKKGACQSTDIFALGSVMYTIMMGYFPHGWRGMKQEQMEEYNRQTTQRLLEYDYPDVGELSVGRIIRACWANQITAERVVQDIADLMD